MPKTMCDDIDEYAKRRSSNPRQRMEWYLSLVVSEYIRNSRDSLPTTETKAIAVRNVLMDFLRVVDMNTFDICSFQRLFHDLLESYLNS